MVLSLNKLQQQNLELWQQTWKMPPVCYSLVEARFRLSSAWHPLGIVGGGPAGHRRGWAPYSPNNSTTQWRGRPWHAWWQWSKSGGPGQPWDSGIGAGSQDLEVNHYVMFLFHLIRCGFTVLESLPQPLADTPSHQGDWQFELNLALSNRRQKSVKASIY